MDQASKKVEQIERPALQNHETKVWFRNIKIEALNKSAK